MQLSEIIRQKIRAEGPVSFHDFMEMCLYYPGSGYYTSFNEQIGKHGDYYTSSSISSLLGAMIARQLEQMWDITGRKEFTVVEYGAGTGMLCHDILKHLEPNTAFYSSLNYCIIEKSPAMLAKEKTHLHDKVSWHDSINELPPVTGCILSNELLDNFSIHQVVMEEELMELFIDYHENGFVEIFRPASPLLTGYFSELGVILPKGFRTEVNLQATEWISEIAACLKKGYVLTIDYGYVSDELYRNCRSNGTLLCYHKHTINDQPYDHIGEQDITAHVNFSALMHWGSKHALITEGLTTQAAFLLSVGCNDYLQQLFLQSNGNYEQRRKYSLLKYTLLVDMGHKFNVLIQRKGLPPAELSGMRYKNFS